MQTPGEASDAGHDRDAGLGPQVEHADVDLGDLHGSRVGVAPTVHERGLHA